MQMERFLTEFLLESFGFTPKKHHEHMKDRLSFKIFQEGYMYLYVLLGFISSRKNMIYCQIVEVWALQTVLPGYVWSKRILKHLQQIHPAFFEYIQSACLWKQAWKQTPKYIKEVRRFTPLKSNIDTQNCHLWKEIHFPNHHFWYLS